MRRIRMRKPPHASVALPAVALAGAALLSGVPGATAATISPQTATRASAVARLSAPVLDSATIRGDNVELLWRAPSGGAAVFAIYANGDFVQRTLSPDSVTVFLASEGLSGRESFTVVAEDRAGNESPPSNAMTPRQVAGLPAPRLNRAVLANDIVTLTWAPSRTNERSGEINYLIYATNQGAEKQLVEMVQNVTTAKIPLNRDVIVLNGQETFTVVARDRTLAESPASNGLVPTRS
jgi:hypothetical protein